MNKRSKNSGMNDIERELLTGLEEFRDALKGDEPISDRFTCRRVVLDLEPQAYTPEMVKAARKMLHVSQGLFAQFLGVSVKTVRAWESGKEPSDIACRFMDEIRRDPDHWQKRLRQLVRIKVKG